MIPTPPTPAELELMKKFWQEEDALNESVSDVSRCIAEIERLRLLLEKPSLNEQNLHPSPIHHWTITCSCRECEASETRELVVFAGPKKCCLLDVFAIDQAGDSRKMVCEIERLQAELERRPGGLTMADVTPDETVPPFKTDYIRTGFGGGAHSSN